MAYTDIDRLFQRGELTAICKAALAQHGPMKHILAAKGLDSGDCVLAKSVAEHLIHALSLTKSHFLRLGQNRRLSGSLRRHAFCS